MREKTVEEFAYYYSENEEFVKEYLNNFEEMDFLLNMIYNKIKNNKDYKIVLNESSIYIENKKTKESYKISIEF